MQLIGALPRPRVLVLGLDDEPDLLSNLKSLIPTVRKIGDIREIRDSEWDAVVTDHAPSLIPRSLCILFKANANSRLIDNSPYPLPMHAAIYVEQNHICNEIEAPDQMQDADVLRLVEERLLPTVIGRDEHQYFKYYVQGAAAMADGGQPSQNLLQPILRAASGVLLAARYTRGEGECWLLPSDVGPLFPWVQAALRSWHDQYPAHFPLISDWRSESRWQSPEEKKIRTELENVRSQRNEAIRGFEQREILLKERLEEASAKAEANDRQLLTGRGDELVSAVTRALKSLAFDVEQMDEKHQGGDLLEDLQVRDCEYPDWIALAEVRSYKRGAQLNDLQRIGRFVLRYLKKTGDEPSARWYIVSQFNTQDPGARPPALESNPVEVDTFASDGGLVIDTVDLFRILVMISDGDVTADSARQLLRTSTGRFALPQPGSG